MKNRTVAFFLLFVLPLLAFVFFQKKDKEEQIFRWRFNYLPKTICQIKALDSGINVDFVIDCLVDSAYYPENECAFTCETREKYKNLRYADFAFISSLDSLAKLMQKNVIVLENQRGDKYFLHERLSVKNCTEVYVMSGWYSAYCNDEYSEFKMIKGDSIITHNHLVFPEDSFSGYSFSWQKEVKLYEHVYFRSKYKNFENLLGHRFHVNDLKITPEDKYVRFHYIVVPSKATKALKSFSSAKGIDNFVITSDWLDLEKALHGY